jgi:hypothetical protein
MTTITRNQWEINGVINTANSVIRNIDDIANASGCFVTWDAGEGTYSVVINDAGTSVYSFDDSNIVGGINVSGTGISELYNSVTIEFPHKDLRDTTDYIDLSIPSADRFPQELDNKLTIRTDLCNDPIQAQLIASRELKQSRLDKTIQFRSNFLANGLKAGDIIDITADAYGYTSKLFRIIEIVEEDTDEGNILFSITALEYDADVYSTADLDRKFRSKKTGIVPKAQNTAITVSESEKTANDLGSLVNALGPAYLLSLLNSGGGGTAGIPYLNTFTVNASTSLVQNVYNSYAGTPTSTFGGFNGDFNQSVNATFSVNEVVNNLFLTILTPSSSFSYYTRINGSDEIRNNFFAYAPSIIRIFNPAGSLLATFTADWQSNTITAVLNNVAPGVYTVIIQPLLTYDIDQEGSYEIYPFNHNIQPNTNGAGISLIGQAYQI